jgi:hypothetical protein
MLTVYQSTARRKLPLHVSFTVNARTPRKELHPRVLYVSKLQNS